MSRLHLSLPLTLLALACSGCRAKPEVCESLAAHISEVAEAEGKGGPGSRYAIEKDCKELPPTRTFVSCVMAAQTLSALDAC